MIGISPDRLVHLQIRDRLTDSQQRRLSRRVRSAKSGRRRRHAATLAH